MLSTLPPPVSTPVAASFLTAIMTPPEAQLTLCNSLVLRAVAAATFPLLLRVSTSYSVYKPQSHPFFSTLQKTSFGAPRRPTQVRASQPSFLFLFSVLFSAVFPSCPALAGGDLQLSLPLPMFVASVDLAPTCCYPDQEHHPYFQSDASLLASVGATGCGTGFAPSSSEGCVSSVWLLFVFNLCNSAYIMLARFVLLM